VLKRNKENALKGLNNPIDRIEEKIIKSKKNYDHDRLHTDDINVFDSVHKNFNKIYNSL